MMFPGPYRVPLATFSTKVVFTNTSGRTAYRGPWQFETLAREMVLDISARRIGIDPIELRRRNLLAKEEMPCANPLGMPYDHMSPSETFEQAVAMLDIEAFRTEQTEARAKGRYLGVGTSTYVEPTTSSMGPFANEGATMQIDSEGKVTVYVNGGSTGNSLETAAVQLTADALSVDIEDVTTIQGDTDVTPYGAGTGGSRSGSMIAGAVEETATVVREKLVELAAQRLEAAEEDIELDRGRAFVRGTPASALTYGELVREGLEVSATYSARSPMLWVNATHLCVCEVDVATGLVTLLRYIVSEDCGPMINPDVVEGQVAGGTVQGIGGALLEEFAHDEDGNPLTTTFLDYLLPTSTEIPVIDIGHVETPGPGPGGYKGVGEGGAIGAPPAVVNAVNDALAPLGVEITRLPASPNSIVALLQGEDG
jgi:aerobic carbon-monoxide dehydrogenase large subunit